MEKTPPLNEDDLVGLEELEEDQELKELGNEELEETEKTKSSEEDDELGLESGDERTGTEEDL